MRDWTWLALQLDDSRELFILVLDRLDGSRLLSAAISDEDCDSRQISASNIDVRPTSSWSLPGSDCSYPMGWSVHIPTENVELTLTPAFEQQEIWVPGLDRYWEGVLYVNGSSTGRGYAELFGYCQP